MTLQEKLTALKNESMSKRPPEIVATLLQETKNLIESGLADKAIGVGETMPEFTLPDEKGNDISSKTLLASGPLAISFYRGVW